jgi:rRNA maturation protein Nop10
MQPYDPKATCPKCGSVNVSVSYCSSCHPLYGPWIGHDAEALHRDCQICHYIWLEEPLDKGKPRVPSPGPLAIPCHCRKCGSYTMTMTDECNVCARERERSEDL